MIPRSFGTHDESFHADEVSACALLLTFNLIDIDKIYRTRDPKVLEQCEFVCDVGGIYDPLHKRFDHHQVEYSGELASAGMIWRYLVEKKYITPALYEYVNQLIIMGVDAHDNGKVVQKEGVCTFSHIIANYVPVAYTASLQEYEEAFLEALGFAVSHFKRLFARYEYIQACKGKIKEAMAYNEKILILEDSMPWQENFFDLGGDHHPALFLLMPAGSHWKLRGIPPNRKEKMAVRFPFPQEWAGLRDEALGQISGIKGAIFCHKGRFISIWETKEDALQAFKLVLQQVEKG